MDPQGGKSRGRRRKGSEGDGGVLAFLHGHNRQSFQESEGVSSKAAAVFDRKGNYNGWASVDGGDLLGGGSIREQLAVFCLFRCVAWNGRDLLEDNVAVQCGGHNARHKVPSLNEED